MSDILNKYDPAVDKRILIAVSGTIWSVVGTMLCYLAATWLTNAAEKNIIWFLLSGITLSALIHHFGFQKLASKNISRILDKEGKVCIFGFQPWKSYIIILIMIGLGTVLRHSALPKSWLAIIYIGFGGAMLLSSFRYHRVFIKLIKHP